MPLCEACHSKVHGRNMLNHRKLTRDALAIKRAKGEVTGGIPYGYRRAPDGKHIEEDEYEKRIITRVQELRTEGLSYEKIARKLIMEGWNPRSGRSWHAMQAKRLCEDTMYGKRLTTY